jgi:hypothetical protein
MLFLRTGLASLLCLAAAVCMRSWGGHLPWQLWIPAGLLGAAALLVHHRHSGSQLLVRAVLWSNLLLGMVVAWAGGGSREVPVAAILAGSTGVALLLLGRHGIDGDARGDRFVPVAFRSTLTAILVMALADAQTLLLFGSLTFSESRSYNTTGLTSLALAIAFFTSIAGLYTLKVWGLLLNLVSCAAIITASAFGAIDLPPLFRWAFIATAALQILLAVPLLAALVTGARRQPPALARGGVWLGAVAIVGVMAAAILPSVM